MNKFAVIGYSGHAYVVLDVAVEKGLQIDGYFDKAKVRNNPQNLQYLGYEREVDTIVLRNYRMLLGIGNNQLRLSIFDFLTSNQCEVLTVIHPQSKISKWARIDEGVFIAPGAVVNAYATVGNAVIVNSGAIVEHECTVQEGAHIAPGAVLAGNVHIGKRSFIGANSVIKEGVTIGEDVIVGAGSVVIHDIANNQKIVGNPGRKL